MQMTWQKRRAPSCSRMERKTLMRRGKRFAKRRERYETAEAALGPETPGAKAFAVSGDRVHAFIAPTLFWSSVNIFACLLSGELGVKPVRRMEQEVIVDD